MADVPLAHPGEVLRDDFLKRLKLSESALAQAIGVATNQVSKIVNGKRAITSEMALRLGRYFGTSAEFWMSLQLSYELEVARDQIGKEIKARVQPRAAAEPWR